MTKNSNRDEFTPATKRAIERQAFSHCSNPACRRLTRANTSDGTGEINIGQAAHICAAAPGGPRYDAAMTSEQRRSADNGIWLCDDHARAVDSKDSTFTPELLRDWKRQTKQDSWLSVMHNIPFGPEMQTLSPDAMRDRVRATAATDLAVFRNTAKWASTDIALTLTIDGLEEPLSTHSLAKAVTTFDDLVLVAAPGMGKTTTLFQVAEGVLETGTGSPLVVLLGEWATGVETLLDSILHRAAFAAVSATDLWAVASKPGVVLLLDGWNELDGAARERARVQITRLQAELPELGMMISTRRQALDVPFKGTRVDLLPLGDEQQMAIARAMRGDAGGALVDQAWRTSGVRDLVTIPLYLTALLSLPSGAPFPTTKEKVLGHFVAAQEHDPARAAALHAQASGLQQDYLRDLAVFATATTNTAISDRNARKVVNQTAQALVADGQIAPASVLADALLNTLVSHHVLMRSSDVAGYAFQHQQFQEWYASQEVEELMLHSVADQAAQRRLQSDVLNQRQWTEAVLFAVERIARGTAEHKSSCAAAILNAFDVDPMLAAEMIFRATDDVWASVSARIMELVRRWHAPGTLDRAVRFMITSGRPEFAEQVWPLLAHPNNQIHLAALRTASPFRPSVLGTDAAERIAALQPDIRKDVLHEVASSSGMDGLDMATLIAKKDTDAEVRAIVVEALSFRRADRHIANLLQDGDNATFDLLALRGHIDDLADAGIQEKLAAARARKKVVERTAPERLREILKSKDVPEFLVEVTELIATMSFDSKDTHTQHLLYEVRQRWPQAIADGLLRRVRDGRELFSGAADILAAAPLALEDDELLNVALQDSKRFDDRANAAASVLGPKAVGVLIDSCIAARKSLRDAEGRRDEASSDRYNTLSLRLGRTPGASLVAAVQARAAAASAEEIRELGDLLSRDATADDGRARPFDEASRSAIVTLALQWGERLLVDERATRWQKAIVARISSHVPSVVLLPVLKRLLDENLARYRAFRAAAEASNWRDRSAVQEVRNPNMHEYQRAFTATPAPETDAMMMGYLTDEHFGESAARVLAAHWFATHEPQDDRRFTSGIDFSLVALRRGALAKDPTQNCLEADAIFAASEQLLSSHPSADKTKLAVTLGIIGARLPHGQRDETIDRLFTVAGRQARASLLLSRVLSGYSIDIALIKDGVADTYEAAKKETWILHDSNAYQLREWLRLLPFSTPISEVPAVMRGLPDAQRNPHFLEEVVRGLGNTPDNGAEAVLFQLAVDNPAYYADHQWQSSCMRLGTASAAQRLIELTVNASLGANSQDAWGWRRQIASLVSEHPTVRAYAHELLRHGPSTLGLTGLALALSEAPSAEDLLQLVEYEMKTGQRILSWHSIRAAATEEVPSPDWKGAYTIVPVSVSAVRRRLLALTTSGDANDPAARCLNAIDKIRDEYGAPEAEPRHPDWHSGRPWPIMVPDAEPVF